ncbi:MAG TPA: C25 family cysteine peptidase, partial [Pyrinomonadaceae bacterium]|nr:C25 family cysteine peptidase [Pyrinomonadaceae bacterium]
MKTSVSILLIAAILFSAGLPVFAQKGRVGRSPGKGVQFERTDALTEGSGVLIRWEMAAGDPTLAFQVFRVGVNGPEQVNERLIEGSMFKRLSPGSTDDYQIFDADGELGSTYVIEALLPDQNRISSQPVGAKYTPDLEAQTGFHRSAMRTGKKGNIVESDRLELTRELEKVVSASQLEANLQEHLRVVGLPGVKLGVKAEGLYRVSRSQLQAAGFDVTSNSANWRLFNEGNEQAIILGPNGDYIEFFGKGIDRPESDTRMYYLIADTTAGKRVDTRVLRPVGGPTVSNTFRFAAVRKERTEYNPKLKNGDEENYFGRTIFSTPDAGFVFNLAGIDPNGPSPVVTIRMQGRFFGQHNVRAVLNGTHIGNVVGEHLDSIATDFSVPTGLLNNGANTLVLNTESSADALHLDTVTVKYDRLYTASENRLAFFTPGYRRVNLGGFTSPNIRVFDVTEDGTPRLIVNLPIEQTGSTHTVRLPSSRPGVFYGVEDSASLQPASVIANTPSHLTASSATNRADVIIISAPELMTASENWAAYRRSPAGGGFAVRVADVTDVVDEFNFGVYSSAAVKNFLQFARNNWFTPAPQYVLLMGDADHDPRGYEGHPAFPRVPTKLVELIFEQNGSDEEMGDFDGDGVSELSIGRIPARSNEVAATLLNKTMVFETTASQSLSRGAVFAFDRPINYDFAAMSAAIKNELPAGVAKTDVFRGPLLGSFDEGHGPLISAINSGKFLVNYSGHGASGIWASQTFFSNDDAATLTNANNQSVFTMLTCFNGFFIRPDADSLSEVLLKAPNGGAVATWASSTETTPVAQLAMGTRFYNRIGQATPTFTRMGDFVRDA